MTHAGDSLVLAHVREFQADRRNAHKRTHSQGDAVGVQVDAHDVRGRHEEVEVSRVDAGDERARCLQHVTHLERAQRYVDARPLEREQKLQIHTEESSPR